MENKIHILSTRELQPDLVQAVQKAGLQADIIPFINIQYRHDEATRKAVHACVKEEAMVVFTSRHGVAAVTNILNTPPLSWHIAALGGATREQAAIYFGEDTVKVTAGTASELASLLQQQLPVRPIIFFAGNIRMSNLPDQLQQAGLTIKEVTVYDTALQPQAVSGDYDAVLFFSPSAAQSFFSANILKPGAVAFAIGHTTAAALRSYTSNEIVISEKHKPEQLIKQLITYYT